MGTKLTWPRETIPPGRQARVSAEPEVWVKRCWDADCGVTWERAGEPFPLYVYEHAKHGATHPGAQIPGWNVGLLP